MFQHLTRHSPQATRRLLSAFTLIELLVVIAIIAILAGLGFAGVNGALKTAKKSEVRAMANQIKVAVENYYAEYGYYPTASNSDAPFVAMMTGSDTANNRRGVRFLELAPKFTSADGLVTPKGFYPSGQSNFQIKVDTNFSGSITAPGDNTKLNQSVAVGVKDPDSTNWIGTWK